MLWFADKYNTKGDIARSCKYVIYKYIVRASTKARQGNTITGEKYGIDRVCHCVSMKIDWKDNFISLVGKRKISHWLYSSDIVKSRKQNIR